MMDREAFQHERKVLDAAHRTDLAGGDRLSHLQRRLCHPGQRRGSIMGAMAMAAFLGAMAAGCASGDDNEQMTPATPSQAADDTAAADADAQAAAGDPVAAPQTSQASAGTDETTATSEASAETAETTVPTLGPGPEGPTTMEAKDECDYTPTTDAEFGRWYHLLRSSECLLDFDADLPGELIAEATRNAQVARDLLTANEQAATGTEPQLVDGDD